MVTQNSINTAYTIGSNQELTQPLQCAFFAYKSADSLNVTGDATLYTVICNTEVYDIGANYNAATGIFTAPVNGFYVISATTKVGGTTAAMITCSGARSDFSGGLVRDVNNIVNLHGKYLYYLSAADTFNITTSFSYGTKVADVLGDANRSTFFSGYLVC